METISTNVKIEEVPKVISDICKTIKEEFPNDMGHPPAQIIQNVLRIEIRAGS